MNIHLKIASALHIACGALTLAFLALAVLIVRGVFPIMDIEPPFVTLAAAVGTFVMGLFLLVGAAQLLAGIFGYRGSAGARIWLVVFSVLSLFNAPLGTAIGAYSLWALLRKAPTA